MIIYNLSSGSKGNATLVECNNINILIDFGLTKKYLLSSIKKINKSISDINIVLITHFHKDHYQKKCEILFDEKIIYSMNKKHNTLVLNKTNKICDIDIIAFELSHDDYCLGFHISNNGKTYTHISDTGYLDEKYYKYINNCDYLYLEFNHHVEMLLNSNRPHYVKKRILSEYGHLNNQDAANILLNVSDRIKTVMLAHISDDANNLDCIKETINDVFNENNKKITFSIIDTEYQKISCMGENNES